MSIQVLIDGVDRTKKISTDSIQIQNILTRKRDTCEFELMNRDSDPYTPIIGEDVQVFLRYDNDGEAIIDSYSEANANNNFFSLSTLGQAFQANRSTKIATAKFDLSRIGNAYGPVVAKLYTMSGVFGTDGKPDVLLATSDSIQIEDMSETVGLVEFTFTGDQKYEMVEDEYYVITVEPDTVGGNINIDNYLNNNFDDSGSVLSHSSFGGGLIMNEITGVSDFRVAMSFNVSELTLLTKASFYLYRNGSRTGNLRLKVYAVSGTVGVDAIPTGAVLATSDPIVADTISYNYPGPMTEFTFSGANQAILSANTSYFLAIESDANDYGFIIFCPTPPLGTSTRGGAYYDGGWVEDHTFDYFFSVDGVTNGYLNVRVDFGAPTHHGNMSMYFSGIWVPVDFAPVDLIFYVYGDTVVQKIFGGVITELEQKAFAFKTVNLKVSCIDYTRILDRRLVADTFTNMTVNEIIASIQADFMPDDFTIDSVDCTILVKYIAFNYITTSKCLEKLADLTGFDFYVDYNKDIHFFNAQDISAPFDVKDDNGTFQYESLVIRRDNTQIRNSILVRGGEYLGDTFTTEILANGTDAIFPLAYKYSDFKATLTGEILNVGIDNIGNPDLYDAMYNFQEKILRFKDARIPSSNSALRISGKPYLPVIVKIKSPGDISTMSADEGGDGIYEGIVIDNTIDSKEGARQRAYAEISAYARTLSEGEFLTTREGLRSGMKILVKSDTRDVNEYFVINKVTAVQFDDGSFIYKISLVTKKTFDLVDLLMRLALQGTQDLVINPNEATDQIIDLVESMDEAMTLSETFTATTSFESFHESATMSETFTAQSLNYDVEFVLGPFVRSGKKRTFILNGSRFSA